MLGMGGFQEFDRDKDGFISVQDLEKALTLISSGGEKVSQADAAQIIKDLDMDKIGMISFDGRSALLTASDFVQQSFFTVFAD